MYLTRWQSIIYYSKLQLNLIIKVYIESRDRSTLILKKTKESQQIDFPLVPNLIARWWLPGVLMFSKLGFLSQTRQEKRRFRYWMGRRLLALMPHTHLVSIYWISFMCQALVQMLISHRLKSLPCGVYILITYTINITKIFNF